MSNPLKDRPDVIGVLAAIRGLNQQAKSLVEKSAADDKDLVFSPALLSERLVEVQNQLLMIESALLNREDLPTTTVRFATAATALALLYQSYIDIFLEELEDEKIKRPQIAPPPLP